MEVREKILSEATRLFAKRGVEATSLQEIADAVGVRKPSLLYHFPSKEALHLGVLENLLSRWSLLLPRLLKAVAREDRHDAILDETVRFFSDDPDRAKLLLREALDRPQEMRALLSAHVRPWLGMIAESIHKAAAQGTIAADADAEAYVLQVIHMVIGTFAAGPITQVLLPGTRAALHVDARLLAELKRMARAALRPRSSQKAQKDGRVARSR